MTGGPDGRARSWAEELGQAIHRLVPPKWRERFHARRWRLWVGGRRAVARGVALGLFCGLLIPFGQIPASLLLAPWLRANLVAAAASTFVTNPLTMPFVYAAGYWLGARCLVAYGALAEVLGVAEQAVLPQMNVVFAEAVVATVIGVVLLASIGAALGYALVWTVWPRHVARRRERGRKRTGAVP